MTAAAEGPAVSRGPVTAWAGVQRRVRSLVPLPIRRADLELFRAVARTEVPVLDAILPRLSHAANHSRLWVGLAAVSAASGGRFGRRAATRGLLAVAATSALTNLPAKLLTGRTRPDLAVVPEVRRLARVPASTSFPSGHSASAFAFATAASLEDPRLRWPLLTLATGVATSRVYTGVHYPGDVLVGSAIGVAVARATTRPWPLADPHPATGAPIASYGRLVGPTGEGLVVVHNAEAGRGSAPVAVDELLRAFPAASSVEVGPEQDLVEALHRAAHDARVLCVAGGDGTVSAGAAAAAEAGVPLAIVPAGTLNHLAKDLGLDEPAATIQAVEAGSAIRADLGEVDGRVFVNAASLGSYPHLVVDRERLEPRVGKWPAALWGIVRMLRTARPEEVEIDGQPRRIWLLFVGNCRFRGDGVPATRRTRLDDGTFDVRVLDAAPRWARTRIAVALLFGRVGRCRAYERRSATEVHVRSRGGPMQLVTDGEAWRGPDEIVFRKRPAALHVVQPSQGDSD